LQGKIASRTLAGFEAIRYSPVTIRLARRVQRIKPSPTLAVTARAARLKAEGKDIVGLGAGEPDFDTPVHIQDAGVAAIRGGFTRYTAVEGTNELKDAIIAKFRRDNGLEYGRAQVLVSSGAKQTVFNLCCALLDAGDEAIIPAPYWVSYADMVLVADGTPVFVHAGIERGFKITAAELEAAITPRTRLFILNSPSNPTGAAYSRAELAAFGAVLERHPQVVVGTDDMYEHIWWGPEPFASFATVNPKLYERTVTINGVSKSYAMTGWRIGYCGGPAEVIAAMATIQGQSTSNASSISQKAATVALNAPQDCVAEMNRAFKARHDLVVAGLNALPGVRCIPGWGTFYVFAQVEEAMRAVGAADDNAFAEFLINEAGVAIVPGSAFGAPGYMRLSFAASEATLVDALGRIGRALAGAKAQKRA
jgi:aspartate aminotransferase